MKRLLLLPVLLLGLCGCALNGTTPAALIVQNQAQIQLAASLATNVAIMNVPTTQRLATSREIYDVAFSINAAVKGGNVDVTQIDALAQALLAKWNSPYEVAAGSVVNLVFDYVQTDLTQYFANDSTGIQKQAIVDLLSSASAGVMNTASLYTQGTPTYPATEKAKVSAKPGTAIVVIHATWK